MKGSSPRRVCISVYSFYLTSESVDQFVVSLFLEQLLNLQPASCYTTTLKEPPAAHLGTELRPHDEVSVAFNTARHGEFQSKKSRQKQIRQANLPRSSRLNPALCSCKTHTTSQQQKINGITTWLDHNTYTKPDKIEANTRQTKERRLGHMACPHQAPLVYW